MRSLAGRSASIVPRAGTRGLHAASPPFDILPPRPRDRTALTKLHPPMYCGIPYCVYDDHFLHVQGHSIAPREYHGRSRTSGVYSGLGRHASGGAVARGRQAGRASGSGCVRGRPLYRGQSVLNLDSDTATHYCRPTKHGGWRVVAIIQQRTWTSEKTGNHLKFLHSLPMQLCAVKTHIRISKNLKKVIDLMQNHSSDPEPSPFPLQSQASSPTGSGNLCVGCNGSTILLQDTVTRLKDFWRQL